MAGEKKPGPGDRRAIYMLGKTSAVMTMIAGAVSAAVLGATVILFGLGGFSHAIPIRIEEHMAAAGLLLSGAGAVQGARVLLAGLREYRGVPYVAPVREQVDALPAHEVLVRGARQPDGSQDELLRMAGPAGEPEQAANRASGGAR